MSINTDPKTLAFVAFVIVAGAIVMLATWKRAQAEEARNKLLKAQLEEQPLRQSVLAAQYAALQAGPDDEAAQPKAAEEAEPTLDEEAEAEPTSLLHRTRSARLEVPAADPYWDALLQFADQQ